MTEELPATRHDPYAALREPGFGWYALGNVLSVLGVQMQTVAVGWEIFQRTGDPLSLGLVGLVQVGPVLAFAIPSGHVADRYDRRHVVFVTSLVMAASSLGLAYLSLTHGAVGWMYAFLLLAGIARAFLRPAKSSLVPLLVPREKFSNAASWNAGGLQLATIVGPAAGGLLIWLSGPASVYFADIVCSAAFAFLVSSIRIRPVAAPPKGTSISDLTAGFRFVRNQPIMLAAMTLDMVGVLLGGATALLPIYANEILHVGSFGQGLLRASEAVGALAMSVWLAHRPPFQNAGRALYLTVVGFAGATIVYGLSSTMWLSMLALFALGAFDMVSVVIRQTLVQVLTPDELRGRVSAVNTLFISVSNELGGFESGVAARYLGTVGSVVAGGIGTLVATAAVNVAWPQLRAVGRLDQVPIPTAPVA
ncbi:MAG TPA: MFS transporter, partial [Pirellulales bacterium]